MSGWKKGEVSGAVKSEMAEIIGEAVLKMEEAIEDGAEVKKQLSIKDRIVVLDKIMEAKLRAAELRGGQQTDEREGLRRKLLAAERKIKQQAIEIKRLRGEI